MREWIVGGGLLLGDAGLLLVRNRRRDGSHDWSPPGGVIEDGEALVDGLTREVAEETGVEVLAWDGPAYEVVVTAPDLGWRARVEAHVATDFRGDLRVDDPDGVVVEAAWVDPAYCHQQLDGVHRWVREPLMAWLDAAVAASLPPQPPTFRYHVTGTDPGTAVVTRIGTREPVGPAAGLGPVGSGNAAGTVDRVAADPAVGVDGAALDRAERAGRDR
jgi:8-oxo-dGTP diphosphatase